MKRERKPKPLPGPVAAENRKKQVRTGIYKPGTGHEKRFLPKHVIELEALGAVLTDKQVAGYYGLTLSRLEDMLNSQPEARMALERGKSSTIYSIGKTLVQVAESGDVPAMKYYLNCQAAWQEKQVVQHEGEVKVTQELTNEAARRVAFLMTLADNNASGKT